MLGPAEISKRAGRMRIELFLLHSRALHRESVGTAPIEDAMNAAMAETITCENCGLNDNCDFAWDLYNTNGDCLAEK